MNKEIEIETEQRQFERQKKEIEEKQFELLKQEETQKKKEATLAAQA